ncbi:hypothetical protein V1478_017983, partial [Vespula squamosa]
PPGVIRARTDGRTLIGLGRSPWGTPAHQLSHSRRRRSGFFSSLPRLSLHFDVDDDDDDYDDDDDDDYDDDENKDELVMHRYGRVCNMWFETRTALFK